MAARCLQFLLLSALLLGLSRGQDTNLTLFKVFPCTSIPPDKVSRFKSDIYAVVPNFSNCSNVSTAALDSGRIVSLFPSSVLFLVGCLLFLSF